MSKKLTFEQFKDLYIKNGACREVFNALQPYLADEQPTEQPQVTNGYQNLFNYMKNEHGVTLLVTDMDEIIRIVQGMHPTKPEPSRLEVVRDVFCALMSKKIMPNEPDVVYAINLALKGADMLIK